MNRIPEPELMDAPEQARAYAEADFSEANGLFVDTLLAEFAQRPDAGLLIDLGCGPGDICLRLAEALPGWSILGIDAGPNMLALAEQARVRAGAASVRFRLSRLPDPALETDRFDAVVSNSLLHHLPEPEVLWEAIQHCAAPGAWVQVMDLERPQSERIADQLVERYAEGAPEVLRQDFRNSLGAAWTVDEVRAQLDRAGLHSLRVDRASDRHWMARGHLQE